VIYIAGKCCDSFTLNSTLLDFTYEIWNKNNAGTWKMFSTYNNRYVTCGLMLKEAQKPLAAVLSNDN
jgi:hypothetical protein